jgi:hypothetical protein
MLAAKISVCHGVGGMSVAGAINDVEQAARKCRCLS